MKKTLAALSLAWLLCVRPAPAQFTEGHVYVTDFLTDEIFEIDPSDWSWRVFTAGGPIDGPSAVGFTQEGRLLVASYLNDSVVEYDGHGNAATVLTAADGVDGPFGENGIALDAQGRVFVSNYNGREIVRFDADYTGGTVIAGSSDGVVHPDGLAFQADGTLLVANRDGGGAVLHIDGSGTVSTWDVIPGEDCFSVVVRDNRDVYVACTSGLTYRYSAGDPRLRTRLGSYGFFNVAMKFSPDFSELYHVNSGDGKFRLIDPDTGDETVVIDAGWDSLAIAVAGSQFPAGSFSTFGTGVAGAGGFVPSIQGTGTPRIGQPVALETRDFVGGATGFLFVSSARQDLPAFGGTLYPSFGAPHWIEVSVLPGAPGAPGEGDEDLGVTLPDDPAHVGTNWYIQRLAVDPAAVRGLSMSNGLRMFIGE